MRARDADAERLKMSEPVQYGVRCHCGMRFDVDFVEAEFYCDRCGAKWRIYEDENFKGTWHYTIDFKPV